MRSIRARFEAEKRNDVTAGDCIIFYRAIVEQGFSRRSIQEWFDKLVDKNEYEVSERNALIRGLHKVSELPEECTYGSENDPQEV